MCEGPLGVKGRVQYAGKGRCRQLISVQCVKTTAIYTRLAVLSLRFCSCSVSF